MEVFLVFKIDSITVALDMVWWHVRRVSNIPSGLASTAVGLAAGDLRETVVCVHSIRALLASSAGCFSSFVSFICLLFSLAMTKAAGSTGQLPRPVHLGGLTGVHYHTTILYTIRGY